MNKDFFLANEPLPIRDGLFLHYPTLREMLLTENSYYENINTLFTQKEHFGSIFENTDLTTLEMIIFLCAQQKDFLKNVISALLYFTKRVFFLNLEEYFFYCLGSDGEVEFILMEKDWDTLIEALAEFNFISLEKIRKDAKGPQYANEAARKFAEKIEATRREVNKFKRKRDSGPFDKVSEMCAKSQNINIMQVWELNYYQYTCQFRDLLKIESYDMTTRAMLAGAKVTLTHWSEQND